MLQRSMGQVAGTRALPTALQAVLGYYAQTGVFDYSSMLLKRRVDRAVDEMVDEAFAPVEEAIAAAFGHDFVSFSYDTKLLLPANLTLGYLYRNLPPVDHDRAERMTRLAVEALLDGDMRDAINDNEFGDFGVDFPTDETDRREVAEVAQEVLESRVERRLDSFPAGVRSAYEWAVEVSERHQAQDHAFRDWMERAQNGDEAALDEIVGEYKHAAFTDPPGLFTDEELGLPYLKTQYDRVGVIYDAMIEMYRAAELPVSDPFQRSIVLAIVGAQVWLDDVDDYHADMREGQLTPVTAEYLLADDDRAAREAVVEVSEAYLDRARNQAAVADSALTGIAAEYIYRDGQPELLPGG